MEPSGQRLRAPGKESPRPPLVAGLRPGSASVVRGSSRRMVIVMAGFGPIHEYQTDQPSRKAPRPLTPRLHPTKKE